MTIEENLQFYAKYYSLKTLRKKDAIILYDKYVDDQKIVYEYSTNCVKYMIDKSNNIYRLCRPGDLFVSCLEDIKLHL